MRYATVCSKSNLEILSELFGQFINRPCAATYLAAWFHLSDCIGKIVDPPDKELLYQLLPLLDMRRALDHHFQDLGRSPGGSFGEIG